MLPSNSAIQLNSLKFLFVAVAVCALISCASVPRDTSSASETPEIQFFTGKIQVSSLDGKTPFGPPYESTVRRIVDAKAGMVEECVLQKGQLFYTLITRTKEPLVYSAIDSDGTFSGTLKFADSRLAAWSYDIQVYSPNKGNLTGSLPDQGAKINFETRTMAIKKNWDGKVLISENYEMTDATVYKEKLKAAKASNPSLIIRENCK